MAVFYMARDLGLLVHIDKVTSGPCSIREEEVRITFTGGPNDLIKTLATYGMAIRIITLVLTMITIWLHRTLRDSNSHLH